MNCLEEAVEYASGIRAAEVYALDDQTGKLVWKGGYCSSSQQQPSYQRRAPFDFSVPAADVVPGTDLVGTLWSSQRNMPPSQTAISQPLPNPPTPPTNRTPRRNSNGTTSAESSTLVYRDLVSLQQDPFVSTSQRLDRLVQAGFTAAAGAPFCQETVRGLVVYYVMADKKKCKTVANETFLLRSAAYISTLR